MTITRNGFRIKVQLQLKLLRCRSKYLVKIIITKVISIKTKLKKIIFHVRFLVTFSLATLVAAPCSAVICPLPVSKLEINVSREEAHARMERLRLESSFRVARIQQEPMGRVKVFVPENLNRERSLSGLFGQHQKIKKSGLVSKIRGGDKTESLKCMLEVIRRNKLILEAIVKTLEASNSANPIITPAQGKILKMAGYLALEMGQQIIINNAPNIFLNPPTSGAKPIGGLLASFIPN